MDEKPYEEIIGRELAFLSEAGFGYEYLYDKGSDSSCVYIYRLKKGRDFLDFRTVAGRRGISSSFRAGDICFPIFGSVTKKCFGRLR